MTQITLVLPFPITANLLWRTTVLNGRAKTYLSPKGKAYKAEVAALCLVAGVRKPLVGRVLLEVFIFPARPKDWQARMRKYGASWDDTVGCLDVDNANKVILDSLKGIAFEDDKWVRELVAIRMEPDQHGARAVVRITSLSTDAPQLPIDLPAEAATPSHQFAADELLTPDADPPF